LIFCGVVIECGISGAIIEGEKIFKSGVDIDQHTSESPSSWAFALGLSG
jgi:hypothetical protein